MNPELLSDLGNVCAVIGAQWGDEAKGKLAHILSDEFDVITRATGGANAGHTVVNNGKKYVFHLLPSGCICEGKPLVIGAGTVIHLPTLIQEIETVEADGISIRDRLTISPSAHIVLEAHKEVDAALEERRNKEQGEGIGTTKRGIGPCYSDKAHRTGIRIESLGYDAAEKLEYSAKHILDSYGVEVNIAQELDVLNKAAEFLEPCIDDAIGVLHGYLHEGKTMVIEGAQATLLDLDHGTYPYVTSSNTTACGALQGLGLPPQALSSCIGVAKAYCTRVGGGPFPTEADEEKAHVLRERGGEYGATTGRPRRTGWLDIADLQYTAAVNGFTHWNLTKLDVLDEEEKIPVGMGIDDDGNTIYEELAGWQSSTAGLSREDDLPENTKKYIAFVEENTGIPVSFIGTGKGKEEMIIR